MTIEEWITKVEVSEKRGSLEDAIKLAGEVVDIFPTDYRGWLLRSSLYEQTMRYKEAISDLDRALIIAPDEPHLLYSRGRYRYELADDKGALEDFSNALVGRSQQNTYYRQEILFWRAETLIRLGNKSAALADVFQVDDDFRTYTYALRTKQDVITDCMTAD